MENLLLNLLESAKKSRVDLCKLKNTAVACQQFELAAKIREIEKELFPDTEEMKEAKSKAEEISMVFRMVQLNIKDDIAWLIFETLKEYAEKNGEFSIQDAVRLELKKQELFFKAES